jgi:hypothetical protein
MAIEESSELGEVFLKELRGILPVEVASGAPESVLVVREEVVRSDQRVRIGLSTSLSDYMWEARIVAQRGDDLEGLRRHCSQVGNI